MLSGTARLFFGFAFFALAAISLPVTANAQVADLNELSEEEQRQVQIAERFVSILEKNPRRGTALDRIYGHHVEFGTLDDFMQGLRDRVKKTPADGTGWMLLGLFEAHRGEDANAIDAFKQAEQFRTDDALASYYLGQSLLLLGQPEDAVAAFERAIDRRPRRTDLLEIFQQLGRVHQRAQRTEDALKVWERLESLFPDDVRVQEQIAVTLVEEGEYGLALPRYENLAKLVRDDYRKTMFRIEAAELKIRENRRDEGITNFETLLGDLNPDGWLHRDVRRRIEDVFLRSGNQDGLVKYYERWISTHPDDVDGMARLARFLASSARIPEATQWMEKALKLAPTRTELRKAFIDQLVDDQRYPEAIRQYELLVESAPGNPDFLRDWGRLVLKNKEIDQQARQAGAARIWKRMLSAQPDDALTTSQVADLFRQSNMNDEALALYQDAVKQAPDDPQYREYLGEFYHILKRSDDALATWEAIAEGPRHNAINVARLAEIYNSFGYLDQAVEQIAEACRLDAKDFALQIKASEYHSRARKFDEALEFVAAAETLAANAEEQDAIIRQRIEVFRASRRLSDEIDLLASTVKDDANASSDQWHLLARYLEADSRWADATEAIDTALQKDAKSIPALTTAARISELSGDYARAANMNRQLSDIDRRSRGDHLMNVARLEAQMGRADEALKAGQDLIVSAPGNTDHYEFYAQLCFQLGKTDDGIDTLRKAVRINPTEPQLIMALGSALSNELRTDEAIEVYWRAFEKTDDLDDRTSLTMKLTDLYLQVNQFDKLLERLERERREEEKRHPMTICLAQAHHSSGDYGTARQELESLLSEDTRDTSLLQQLSKLCEEGSDVDGAIEYQRQLADIAPGHETEYRLATLLQQRGDRDQAGEILLNLMQREEDPTRRLRSLDSLLSQGAYENVIAITEPLLSEQRDDWELLYREAVAWASLEKPQEAQNRFDRLLSLPVVHDQLGIVAADKFKRAQAKARSNNLRGIQSQMPTRRSPMSMLNTSHMVRRAVGLDPDRSYYGSTRRAPPVWTPDAFGEARMAAYAWLIRFDQQNDSAADDAPDALNKRFDELGAAAAADDADRETLYDWMYVEQLRGNRDSIFRVARRLARAGGREEQQFFLSSLTMRGVNSNSQQQVSGSGNQQPKREPLSDDDLELMLNCHEMLTSGDIDASMFGAQFAYGSNGQVYVQVAGNWVVVPGLVRGAASAAMVIEELKLAGRTEQAEQLLQKQIDSAETAQELAGAMSMFFQEEKYDRVDEYFPLWMEAAHDDIAGGPTAATTATHRAARATGGVVDPLAPASNLLMNWMGYLGPEEEHAKLLSILDGALEISTEVARRRRAERSKRKRRSSATPTYYNRSYSLKYGKESIRVQFDYPQPNEYVDHTTLVLLRQVYEIFKRNEVLDDLPVHLEQRLQAADKDDKLYGTLMLAYVRWWLEEKEDALGLLKQAGAQLNDDPAFRLQIASLHQSMGDLEDALDIVESIVPRDQKLVQQREIMALQLAERLGDIDRARQSAERLFGLRLDNNTQLGLVEQMRRLGMHEMAEAIVSRVQRRSGNSLTSMGSLMALYQSQGKSDLAGQLAHTVLRRTTSPLSAMNSAGRNPFRYSSSNSEAQIRTQALRLLQQSGALKDLITRVESQIERSPNSPRLYGELIEYYEAANQRDKVAGLLTKAVENRPDSVVLRYRLAKHLESSGKQSEACDQYLAILQRKPQWISEDLYNVRRTFERCNRTLDLIKGIENINLKLFSSPYYVVDLVTNIMQGRGAEKTEENLEVALNLFERVFDAFPTYRNRMISRMSDRNLWKNDRVFQLGKQAILPTESEVATNPWFGLDSIYSYSSGGQVNAQFHQILSGIQGSPKMGELKKIIEQRIKDAPDWHGGRAMLALIDLKQNRRAEAKKRFEELVADEELLKAIPSGACWIVGQELDQFEDTRPVALTLFETAIRNPGSQNQIQYSPVARLIKLYADIGRRDDARDMLIKQAARTTFEHYDAQYSSYLHIQNSVWAGQQLLDMDCAVDAVRIFRGMSANSAALEAAGQWYGGQPNHYKAEVEKGLNKALAALDSADADEAMAQLLDVPEKLKDGMPALDIMLIVPGINAIREKPIQSPLVDLLMTISKEDAIANSIQKRLADLRADRPADLSVGVTESAYLMRRKDERTDDAVRALLAAVADNPLEEIRAGRRPNSRQRREALGQVSLWLIARECLRSGDRQDAGAQLAERALEAARRQSGTQHTAAILYDWGKVALDRGDREQAEEKWSELLDIVTRRPERKAPKPAPRTGALDRRSNGNVAVDTVFVAFQRRPAGRGRGPARPTPTAPSRPAGKSPTASRRIPPLTISQFRLTMEIALAAAENGMAELSRKAVKASMVGGTPVADVSSSTNGRPGMIAAPVLSSGTPGNNSGSSQIETEVAESIRKVVAKWQGDAYPPEEVYGLLVPIVFPENRPAEILMYADSSNLQQAQVRSLGAVLVQWAKKADQLDDLVERTKARGQNTQTKVPALVMLTRAEIARGTAAAAKPAMTELAEIVQKGTLPAMVQLACHAALPASDREPLAEPAYAILKAAVNMQFQAAAANRNSGSGDLSLGGLVAKVNRHLSGEPGEVKKFFENYLVGRQSYYSRYSGDYGQYLQWRDWASIAEEAAKVGLPTVALDYMGRVADFSYERYSRPSTKTALAVVCREMSLLSPQKQYESWRDWTLPTEGRQTVRLAAEWVEPVRSPAAFLEQAGVRGQLHAGDLVSSFTSLLDSADQAGRLVELRDLVKPAFDEKLENADFLYALILVRLGEKEAANEAIAPITKSIRTRLKRENGKPRPEGWGDYLLYRACLESPDFSSIYASRSPSNRAALHRAMRTIYKTDTLTRINVDFARRAGQTRPATIRPGDDPQLAHWFPATTRQTNPVGVDPWWVLHEGQIVHLAGAGSDLMYFAYPVTGDFEFTVDAWKGSWAETDAGYGGIIVEAQQSSSRTTVWSAGGHESVNRAQALRRDNEWFGTITIKVANGRLQHIVNNHIVYEEELSGTSPWITLYTDHPRATVFRNPRFAGNPVIPREVVLANGNRLDGWNTSFFSEKQPRHRLMALKVQNENDYQAYQQREEPTEFDWRADDGLIIGRARAGSRTAQSWAYYHRPLRNNETFSYDFYYVPGESVAHPTIGRIALMLDADGIDEHWITRMGWDDAVLGLTEDNRLTNADARRGPETLPLNAGEWNNVTMTLVGDAVRLTLNGQPVYERQLDPGVDHRFGLFRRKRQSLKVRHPKLSGSWPETLTPAIRNDLLASTKTYSRTDSLLISSILGQKFAKRGTADMVRRARTLPPDQAYDELVAWVLPSEAHSNRRLYFDFVQTTDVRSRFDMLCPALEMIAVAEKAGRLDELAETIGSLRTGSTRALRGQAGLEALLAMHRGDYGAAREKIAILHEHVAKGFSKTLSPADRAVDLVVAWEAVKIPELLFAGYDISYELQRKQRDKKFKSDNGHWAKCVDILVGHVDGAMLGRPRHAPADTQLTQWANVPYYKPQLRSKGYRHTQWKYQRGMVQHLPGGTWGQLFFQSPLRGNFEIHAERALHGYREVAIAYGMHSAEPRYDYKAVRVSKVMHQTRDIDGEVKIPGQGNYVADFRIVVNDNKITTFVNDTQIHEESLSPQPDPWLLLQSHDPGFASTVRSLRIVGTPEIPDEIDLIEIAGWASWRADMYGEWFSLKQDDEGSPWHKKGDELHGRLRKNFAVSHLESLLMYQRPMLEDGVIEFESFHVPGEFEVHPAVGRTALLVSGAGVQRHTLTDAQYDQSGLTPDNAAPVDSAAESVALKENDWNRYRLTLEGDQLTLAVNGTDVATVTLTDSPGERHFGLFRYSNKTKCRVRNLVYRGDWPKTLPAIAQQQLSLPSGSGAPANWSGGAVIAFDRSAADLKANGLQIEPADRVTPVEQGTRLLLKDADGYGAWPKMFLRKPIEGDFVATLDFRDLKMKPVKGGWGSTFAIRIEVENDTELWVECGVGMNKDGTQTLKTARRHIKVSGGNHHEGRYLPARFDAGRFRIARTGPVLSTYFAAADSQEFRLLEVFPVGNAPVKAVTVQSGSSDSAALIDVVVTQLAIETQNSFKTAAAGK